MAAAPEPPRAWLLVDPWHRNALALFLGGGSLVGLVASAWVMGERAPDWLPSGLIATLASVTSYYFASRTAEQATRLAEATQADAAAVGLSGAQVQRELLHARQELAQAVAVLAALAEDPATARKVEELTQRVLQQEKSR